MLKKYINIINIITFREKVSMEYGNNNIKIFLLPNIYRIGRLERNGQ